MTTAEEQTNMLLKAASQGDTETVLMLLDDGVPVDSAHSNGLTALHFAAKTGNLELATELITRKSNVNASTLKGSTPLHVATLLGQTDVVKLLLKYGADVNVKSVYNEDHFTPLYMAAQIGHQEIVTLLLAHCADTTAMTNNGCTARDVAEQEGHKSLAELLDEYERRTRALKAESGGGGGPSLATTTTDQGSPLKPPITKHSPTAANSKSPPRFDDVMAPSPKHVPAATNQLNLNGQI